MRGKQEPEATYVDQDVFEEHVAILQQPAPFTVYLYYDRADRLLYVGITGRGIDRSREHSRYSVWWQLATRSEIEHYETQADARAAERAYIGQFRPLFNIADVPAEENPLEPRDSHPPFGGEGRRPVREGSGGRTASEELSSDGKTKLWDGYVNEKDKDLRTSWGLKLEQWEAINKAGDPNGGCAVCHRRAPQLVVDDDHDTGEICGTLCHACNRKLSEQMRRYAQNPPARQVGPFFISEKRQAARIQARLRREERKTKKPTKAPSPTTNGSFADKMAAARQELEGGS